MELPQQPILNKWYDRHTPIAQTTRGMAEEELLALSPHIPTTVINLAGLWGGARSPRNWVTRVASTKEALRNKVSSLFFPFRKWLYQEFRGVYIWYTVLMWLVLFSRFMQIFRRPRDRDGCSLMVVCTTGGTLHRLGAPLQNPL